ncbi:NusB antitermination factor [Ruminococcaceae bacterium YRB3002]|nr:NusB antitermination factor [Ruminococcaceae bacterium YRB3002]
MSEVKNSGRIKAREAALMFLYQDYFNKTDYLDQLVMFRSDDEIAQMVDGDIEYFKLITKGVIEKKDELISKFAPYLKKWTPDRLPVLDRIILEIAVYEIMFVDSVHTSVAINEAVRLAKKYGTDNSSSYINGVLSSFEKDQ